MAECTICYEPMQRNLSACPCGHVFRFTAFSGGSVTPSTGSAHPVPRGVP